MLDDASNRLIGSIYQGAIQGEWDETTSDIARYVGADVIQLLLGDPLSQIMESSPDADPLIGKEYLDKYHSEDLRLRRLPFVRKNVLRPERELLSEAEYESSAVHQELFPKYGIHDLHYAVLDVGGARGWAGFSVPKSKRGFEEEDLAKIRFLLPHLRRALKIAKAKHDAGTEIDLLGQVFDENACAQILWPVAAGKHYLNRKAEHLLSAGVFEMIGGRLRTNCRAANAQISDFLGSARSGDNATILFKPRGQDLDFTILISRGEAASRSNADAFVEFVHVKIFEPALPAAISLTDVKTFAEPYGLSPAEQEVVWFVVNLKPLSEFARLRGVRIDTARKQLKSALRKLNLDGQKSLLRAFDMAMMAGPFR